MIQPFGNAIEYMTWDENNCCHCKRYDACEIQDTLTISTMTLTGEISEEIANRAGLPGEKCKEKEEA